MSDNFLVWRQTNQYLHHCFPIAYLIIIAACSDPHTIPKHPPLSGHDAASGGLPAIRWHNPGPKPPGPPRSWLISPQTVWHPVSDQAKLSLSHGADIRHTFREVFFPTFILKRRFYSTGYGRIRACRPRQDGRTARGSGRGRGDRGDEPVPCLTITDRPTALFPDYSRLEPASNNYEIDYRLRVLYNPGDMDSGGGTGTAHIRRPTLPEESIPRITQNLDSGCV